MLLTLHVRQEDAGLLALGQTVRFRPDGSTEDRHRQLAEAGVDAAYREGNLRLSVHLFNTPAEVDRALDLLHA